jgi:hypothetical protein
LNATVQACVFTILCTNVENKDVQYVLLKSFVRVEQRKSTVDLAEVVCIVRSITSSSILANLVTVQLFVSCIQTLAKKFAFLVTVLKSANINR